MVLSRTYSYSKTYKKRCSRISTRDRHLKVSLILPLERRRRGLVFLKPLIIRKKRILLLIIEIHLRI